MASAELARHMWDPTSPSAQIERQVKIRAALDLTSVLLTVPSAYRGVLSDLFGNYTDLVEQRDSLSRAKTKLEKLKTKGEFPFAYNSLKLPTVQYQKGSRDLWNETWSVPAAGRLVSLKKLLMDDEINLVNAQLKRIGDSLDERDQVQKAWVVLAETFARRPQEQLYKVATPADTADWPAEATLEVSNVNPLKNELQSLQVDLPVYFRKVLDLKLDLIERIHGRKDKKAAEKRDVDMAVQDVASTATTEVERTINNTVQSQLAAAMKAAGIVPAPSSSKKVRHRSQIFHQDPTHSTSSARQQFSEEAGPYFEGEEEGEEGRTTEGGYSAQRQGGSSSETSWRRQRSQEEWALREGKREAERTVEVLKSKPWTFGKPWSYPDEILTLSPTYQATVLLSRAPVTLLDANRFRSPIHVQPGLDVPIQIQHDLSASLKFMFETKIDKSLIQKAYTDLVRRIRWKWHFMDQVGDEYDPDYDVGKMAPSTEEEEKKKKQPPPASPHIERGIHAGQDYVNSILTSLPGVDMVKRPPVPLNLKRAQEFVVANNLIVTSTDKNLGVAVFKREWIYHQACALFDDADNYTSLTVQEAVTYLSEMATVIRELCNNHLQDSEQLSTFLSHCIPDADKVNDWANWKKYVPEAYAIPKIHKNPWKGRPICPGFCLPQNAASKVLAKVVRPYIESCPWVIKGSKDFVQKLAQVKIPPGRKAFIVSADVVAFYPSVDIETLRTILHDFADNTIIPMEVTQGEIPLSDAERRLDYYDRLFQIAIAGPIMTFNDKIIYQHRGLPMGAAGSPDAANIFGVWYELMWMEQVTSNDDILFYGRYLDDIYSIVLADTPDEAKEMLSFVSLGDVNLLWEPPADQVNFLDLATRIDGDRITHEPFVKAMSHRERIPWSSGHPLDVKRGTFSSEISRLATLCSEKPVYLNQCNEAVNLYIGRAYPSALVTSWLKVQQEKRWELRIADKTAEEPTRTFFTLKTYFNEAWKGFNVHELQTRIMSEWKRYLPDAPVVLGRRTRDHEGGVIPRQRKRVRIALQGQQWPGQSRLTFAQEDGSDPVEGIRIGGGHDDILEYGHRLQVSKWTRTWIDTGKFLVSRKKNTQLWDLTRTWNRTVWDNYLAGTGAYRPFDPLYEGLIVPGEDDE